MEARTFEKKFLTCLCVLGNISSCRFFRERRNSGHKTPDENLENRILRKMNLS